MYKLTAINVFTQKHDNVQRLSDNAFIPLDPDNTDYQAYLKWLEDPANQPLPADESQA